MHEATTFRPHPTALRPPAVIAGLDPAAAHPAAVIAGLDPATAHPAAVIAGLDPATQGNKHRGPARRIPRSRQGMTAETLVKRSAP
ncbi:MAG: hypothetical protein AAFN05_02005 [Pseudomonadota bacterium]